jgi:hypothetical protein
LRNARANYFLSGLEPSETSLLATGPQRIDLGLSRKSTFKDTV